GRLKRRRQRVLVRSLARREPVPDFSCPVSRLQLARDEINKTLALRVSEQQPEVLVAVLNAASSDWAASRQSSEWPRPCCWRRRQGRRTVAASCRARRGWAHERAAADRGLVDPAVGYTAQKIATCATRWMTLAAKKKARWSCAVPGIARPRIDLRGVQVSHQISTPIMRLW